MPKSENKISSNFRTVSEGGDAYDKAPEESANIIASLRRMSPRKIRRIFREKSNIREDSHRESGKPWPGAGNVGARCPERKRGDPPRQSQRAG